MSLKETFSNKVNLELLTLDSKKKKKKKKFFWFPFRDFMLRFPFDTFNSLNGNIACFNTTTREMVKSFLVPVLI